MATPRFVLLLLVAGLYACLSYAFGAAAGMAVGGDPHTLGIVLGGASLATTAVRSFTPFGRFAFAGVPGVQAMTAKRALLQEIDYLNKSVYGLQNTTELPGYIRSEVQLLGTTNSFTFAIGTNETANGQAVQNFENRLNINDAFYITHFGVMFYQTLTADGVPGRARARMETFPNEFVFGTNTPSIAAAYNGKLALRVDDTVYMDSLDMLRFQNAQTAQKGQAVSTVATVGITNQSAWSQDEAFMLSVDPLVRLNGPGKNIFTVTLPDAVNFAILAGSQVTSVLYLRGWLSQNGGGFRATNG